MSVSTHSTIQDSTQANGQRRLRYRYDFTQGDQIVYGPFLAASAFDDATDRAGRVTAIELDRAWKEVYNALDVARGYESPEKTAEYQAQNDFDRRLLGVLMLEPDIYIILYSFPFFDAVQTRGGNNASQRATYLGVDGAEYTQVNNRFQGVKDREFFLTDQNGYLWDNYPSAAWGQ